MVCIYSLKVLQAQLIILSMHEAVWKKNSQFYT